MTPIKIPLVENCDGVRRISWLGVFKAGFLIFLISAPIAAIAALIMGPLPIVMIVVVMVGILATGVRAGFSGPIEQLQKRKLPSN